MLHTFFHTLSVSILFFAFLDNARGAGAPLPENPNSLHQKSDAIRTSSLLTWDLSKGQLGNLKNLQLIAKNCSVRIVSGQENKIIGPMDMISVYEEQQASIDIKNRQVVIRTIATKDFPKNRPCLTLQLATADDLILSGDNAHILFDHFQSIYTRIYLNPSSLMRIWFDRASIGHLELTSNSRGSIVGGDGKIDWLTLNSSQEFEKLYFHNVDADHIGVSATTTNVQFSIRINPNTDAGYYQPARAPGKIALKYPIWIEGKIQDLKVPAGNVNPMKLTVEIKEETEELRKSMLKVMGPLEPQVDKLNFEKSDQKMEPLPRQQVANALEEYLPKGVALTEVEIHKNGGALLGVAEAKPQIDEFVNSLLKSPDLTYIQKAFIQQQTKGFTFRLLFNLRCPDPDKKILTCQKENGEHDMELIQKELQILLGEDVKIVDLKLGSEFLTLKAKVTDVQGQKISQSFGKDVDWFQVSSSGYGNGNYTGFLRLRCLPRAPRKLAHLCSVTKNN